MARPRGSTAMNPPPYADNQRGYPPDDTPTFVWPAHVAMIRPAAADHRSMDIRTHGILDGALRPPAAAPPTLRTAW